MSDSGRARTVRRLTGGLLIALSIGLAIERAGAQQQQGSAGANVNVISGTGADGDWTLQRQNEPTIACSSRNPQNCLAGANDYRTVDIPFPTIGEKITGDAWLGWYTTKNGGLTWRTRLLPGYPQDVSPAGTTSPLRGYPAGADPIIRSGTNGMFYYGGLVFSRNEEEGSTIFVARFIDNNNQEGIAGEPIAYLGTSVVQRIGAAPVVARRQGRGERPDTRVAARREREEREREDRQREQREREREREQSKGRPVRAGAEQSGELTVDKPWMAVDVPRAGAGTCSIGGSGTGVPLQTFPGGRVYMAYALFDGPGEERGRLMFSYSADCALTWSPPRVISRVPSGDVNDDGVGNAADVAALQASYTKKCGQTGFNPNADTNNDCKVDLLDLGFVSRAVGQPVPKQPRLSQGATLAIDPQTGTLQIAWRQFNDGVLPDAIVTVRSTNGGATVSAPRVVATIRPFEQGTTNTSFRTNAFPTLTMDGTGRAYLAWSARGYATQRPSPTTGDGRIVLSTSTDGLTWSTPSPVDNQGNPGHQIMPALTFAQGKLQLVYYDLREDVSQLFGPYVDESPILSGPQPRVRHTFDVWAAQAGPAANPTFTAFRLSQYRSGGVPGARTVQQLEFSPPNLPIFRAGTSPFMGDYLDVTTASPFVRNGSTWSFNTAPSESPVFHGIWTDNRDIRPPVNGRWTDYTPPNPPFTRPAMSGFDPTQPIPACVPGQAGMRNQNIYTARITRGLVVGALGNSRRLSSIQRSFPVFAQNNATTVRSYRLTIANQPAGGQASFKQFDQLATLDVQVPPRSTVARTVFARSTTDPHAPINVTVVEISAPGGAPVAGGQQGTIALNPDPTNPDLENPDLENPDLENPDLENSEVHNPDLENATVRNPDLENPDLENPDLENPDLENTTVANPSILNPDLENPDLENPDLENPDLENPDLENVDLVNGALSDTTWTVTNKGNTASAYTVRLALNRQFPPGFKSQLIAHKIYQTPAAVGCSLLKQSQTVLLANIPNPRFVTGAELANPDLENPDLENLTIAIAPGETARITLRVFDPIKTDAVTFRAAESVTPVAVAQAVNTPEADRGITQPAAAGVLTSNAPVPGGTSGGSYATTLSSILPGTWTVAGGTVPPGLTVNPITGAVTGTPTTPGTYTFTARFQSATGIIDYQTVRITVGAVGAAANVGVSAAAPVTPVAIGTPFAFTLNVSNIGPASATNVRVTDTLPEGTTFVSATTTAGSCQHANGTLICNLGTLASGGAAAITLNVRPTVGGTHTNTAVVTATEADPVATNNSTITTTSTSVTVTPCATVCFSGPTSYIAGPTDPEFGAEKGDFNGDGFVDLIFGPLGVNTVGVMLANGAGGFGPTLLITIPGSPNGAAVADFNNDGHQDVVISSERTAEAWLLIGNGLGQFGAPVIVPLPTTPQNVVAADFNRDGNVDVALAGDTGPLVMILHGNGNGTFQPTTTIGTTTTFSTVVTDDVNNDTNPDLVVHQEEVGLVIILGNGAAGFQPPTTIPITDISGIIKTGDLTGDGFADLILGSVPPTGAELHLYVGNGLGGFTQSVMIGDPALTDGAPAVGDLDSDGDLDVVWGRSGGGVAIQLNNGSGTFAAPIYLASPQVGQILVADYNGDGRPDLALPIGDALQSQFLVFLNTCDQPPAELAVTLTGPTGPVAEGSPFTYNIEVTNSGPNPATGVQLDFAFDPSAEFVAIGGSPGSCSVVGNRVTCQLGTLAIGAVSAFAIDVLPRSGGTLQATAGVTGTTSDPNPANNTAFASTTITPGASTLVVTNTNRSGPGSLYQAIVDANDPGPRDTITFNIPGPGPHTIAPSGDLPEITQPVVIDGTTQPGYAGTPLIEINGQNAGTAYGLVVNGSNSIVRGLAINRFHHVGIVLSGAGGHRLEGNFIGTNTSGTAALGNLEQGVFVSSPNNVIGGATAAARNVISGNTAQGVIIANAASTGNVVSGNFVGSNLSGTARIPNGGAGVAVTSGASNNTIGGTTAGAGNLLSGNTGPGVTINTAGTTRNTVAGNFIGTNAAGSAALFNGNAGVVLNTGTTNNTVGGTTAAARNVISGNNQSGVTVSGAGTSGNTVAGNYIGTNAAGTAAIPNGNNGVTINGSATNNTIGGTAAGAGNVISGNPVQGIAINTAGTSGNAVVGNFIGTNAAGTAAVANGHGISVSGAATNNTIGGAVTNARNVISGNTQMGVRLVDIGTTGNRVLGNFIGTNATGTAAVPNGAYGVDVSNTAGANTIGGEQTGEGNVISGNLLSGVAFRGAATDAGGNTLVGNLIGTDAAGTAAIGNVLTGIFVMTSNNRIGSLTTTIGNTIAFNGENGVLVSSGTGNAIVNNRIFSNGSLGIDLGNNGITPNDIGDADAGANNLQNFPLLAGAIGGVQGTLNSTPSSTFRIEFFGNTSCDGSGNGEGAILLGVTSVTTNASGNATIPLFAAATGQFVSATATDVAGNTSEFSACVPVTIGENLQADVAVTTADSPDPVVLGEQLGYAVTVTNNGPNPATNVRINVVWNSAVNLDAMAPSQGTCELLPVLECSLGTLASGATATVGIAVRATVIGTLTSTTTVQANETDPTAGNNTAAVNTTVVGTPFSFQVTTTNDTGGGSLRQAILNANASAGANTITFNLPGSGVRSILTTGLPPITERVTIDGTSQPGFTQTPLIELNGSDAGPGANGLVVNGGGSVIRGLIINRFTGSGIVLQSEPGSIVTGNWIGTTSTGAAAAGNGDGILVQTSGHRIGGGEAAERNVISGNTVGVNIAASAARSNAVIGNYIGTDVSGALDVGNTQAGVRVIGEANTIGGIGVGMANVISGNDQAGVLFDGFATANTVESNAIGTNAARTAARPNGVGVNIGGLQGASSNRIGGVLIGSGNLIAFNSGAGIVVTNASSNNSILENSIRDNGGLGIDLGADGVTLNDPDDTDEGPNDRVNFPVLTAVAGGVQGTFSSIPNTTFRIDLFATAACDASGYGEGATLAYRGTVTTDAAGNATIPLFIFLDGSVVTATATDSSGNTSEFAACAQVVAVADLALTKIDTPDPVNLGAPLTYTVTVTNNGPGAAAGVTVEDQLSTPSVTLVSATPSQGTCAGTALVTCSLGTLANGATATVTIVVTPNVAGTINNTATVTSSTTDSNPNNNGAIISTTVANVPQTFVVTNTNASGAGSLRQAILDANAHVGPDTITFAIPGTGVRSISDSALVINDPVTLDATTQAGFAGTPIVELNASAGVNAPGLVVNTSNTVIRGFIVNRAAGPGIVVQGGTNNRVEGNWIGINSAGTAAAPNGAGVYVLSSANTIGGTTAAARNVISGNSGPGVSLYNGAQGNVVAGNFIGTTLAGTAALPNSIGVLIGFGVDSIATGNTIGGFLTGSANVIAFNSTMGVSVAAGSINNAIRGNSIHDNGTLGIDLNGDGVTANDAGDTDAGANGLQNFPVLTGVPGGVQGTLNSTPNALFLISFFGSTACDASGNGEGGTFLGDTSASTDAAGNATIPLFTAAPGQFVTATATNISNNTSEFSACVTPSTAIAQHSGATDPVAEGFTRFSTVTNTAPIINDGGFDAWQLTGSGGSGFYGRPVNYAPGFVQGWRMTARVRVLSGTGWSYFGLITATDRPRFDVGVRTVGADTEVGLFDSNTTTSLAYTIPGDANRWVFLELVYDPATALATLFVNGIERLTGYPGFGAFRTGDGLNFGAQGATANFNLVKFEIPATPASPTSPTTSYAAWRAGAPAGLTTADFEPFSTGTILAGTEYAGLGLTLTQRDDDPMRVVAAGDGSFVSAANLRSPTHGVSSSGVPGFPFGYDDTRSENYDFTFTNPQTSVGLWIGNLNPGFNTIAVQFLNDGGAIIATLPMTTLDANLVVGNAGQFDNRLFVGINSSTPVKRIRVVQPDGDADGIVIDDVVWGAGSSLSPILTSLSPASATAGGAGFTLTVNGSDFVPGAVVFWDGAARATTFVNNGQVRATIPAGDLAAAGTANVSVSNPGTAEPSNGLPFTILPAQVQLAATDPDAAELGGNTATVVVTRSGATTAARDVVVNLTGTAATNGTDYTISSPSLLGAANPTSFTLRIPAGQTTATVTITPIYAPEIEGPETVTLSAEGSQATVTIADEPAVTLTATDPNAAELGANTGTVVVTRTGPSGYDRDVVVSLSGTAANNGSDYTVSSPALLGAANPTFFTLRIPAGQTTATVTITPIYSPEIEGPETVTLSADGNQATVTIADEPAVTLTATDPNAAELGANTGTVVVTRTGPSGYDRDVVVSLSGTAANNGSDYTVSSPSLLGAANPTFFTLRIPAGQTTATVTITPVADAVAEPSETVILTAEGSIATVTIVDQFAPVTFTVTNTNNAGAGSLRQAILDANASPAADFISFAIPGSGVRTIAPLSGLPVISDPVTIDGATQPGFAGVPLIELDGTNAGGTASGLFITAGNSVVRGLIVNRFGTGGPASQPPASDGGGGIVLVTAGNNVVEGNYVGTDATGTLARPNRTDGIWMNSANNRIGGTTVAARNVVSGNGWRGIVVNGGNTNRILGNYVGVDPSGLADLGNGLEGVAIFNGSQNLVGGLPTAGRNVISGNGTSGIVISGSGTFNEARGNLIGTTVTGTSPMPNGAAGITIASSQNFIGDAAAPNTIAFNGTDGIRILSGTASVLSSNSILLNTGLGINLNGDGITANDAGDTDAGPNGLQNFPVLTAAAGGVQGTLNSAPNASFQLEFFGNVACDASGNGEGATFLGSALVATDATGNAAIPLFTAATGQFVTATATSQSNNTSEFSACVQPLSSTLRLWVSNSNGFWEDSQNWAGGIVPDDGDDVVIDRPGANPVVTVQSAVVRLASLRSEELLAVTGGSLTFDGAVQLNGGLTMSGGLISGAGNVTLGSASLWTGGNISGAGLMTVPAGASLTVSSPGVPGVLGRSLSNSGVLIWNQPQLSLVDGAQIVNQLGGVFEVQGNLEIVNATSFDPLLLTNHGFMLKSGAGGPITLIGVAFATTGTLQLRLGPVSDEIFSTETGSIAGALTVALQPGFVPTQGAQFDILSFSALTGTFAGINGGGQTYTPTYTSTGLTLLVGSSGGAELALSKVAAPNPATVGAPLIYGLTVVNNGLGSAQDVVVTDTLPGSVAFLSASPSQGTCSGTVTVTCNMGALAGDANASIIIVVTPSLTGTIVNTATVTTTSTDPNTANNTATIQTAVGNPSLTFVVTNTNDTGAGSLRQAIASANANVAAHDTITFDIPGAGQQIIRPGSALPTITDPVTIDGSTQPTYVNAPVIELNGSNTGATANGLFITAGNSIVTGLAISGFGTGGAVGAAGGAAIVIQGTGSNVIQDNYLGIGSDGAVNRSDGIFVDNSPSNQIGGSDLVRNIISDNGRNGITLNGAGTTGTIVVGNFIGTDPTGSSARANANHGVSVFDSPANILGADLGNVISGNAQAGIMINGSQSTFNIVSANIIGTDAGGGEAIANGASGIVVAGGAGNNLIGRFGGTTGNLIAFNTQSGIRVLGGAGNAIQGNSIVANGLLGIDLGGVGVTANDPGDGDTGANNLQNFPVLSALPGGVQATINTAPNTPVTIEFYANQACDPSGYGEGASSLGTVAVVTDAFGNAATPLFAAAVGQRVSATATDAANNTSEFSLCVLLQPSMTLTLPGGLPVGVGQSVTATVTLTQPAPTGGLVVTITSDAPGTASIAAPGTVAIAGGSSGGQFTVNGIAVGSTTLRANAPGYAEATVNVTVIQ